MKKIYLLLASLAVFVAAGAILRCDFETASGPTPYSLFDGHATSTSSVSVGEGNKSFVIQPGFVMTSIGQWITITPANGDTSMFMSGTIKSYDRNTGTLMVSVTSSKGEGTNNNWTIVSGRTKSKLDSLKQAYADLKFGMFFHFNMSTFDRCCCSRCYSVSGEWGLGMPNPDDKLTNAKKFNPTRLNCGQWADAAKAAGCKYMVLVAKHHDGFCLWPTQYSEYCVTNATCTTDVVRQFCDSARSRGMRVGFYYSIRDLSNGYTIPFVKGQLAELLSNYGDDILCLWFDGWGWDAGYSLATGVPYDTVKNLIKSIQPNCLIVENNHEFATTHSDMLEWEMPIDGPPPITNILPAEGNEPIRYSPAEKERCWFWHPNGNCDLMPAQMIVDHLKSNNKGNAAYLLDLTPDTAGLIPDCQVQMMENVGNLLGIGTSDSYTGQ